MQYHLWCFPVPDIEMRPMITDAGAGGGHLMDKQSLVPPVVQELWNAWEIHLMILLSLSLQVFLFLFAGMRRFSSNWFLRTVLWLAYLSADAVAVFVLGHLAVRAREPGHELMALWAPFVLVHLGGQDTITAFSKQDNELWRRHLLNLVLQAAVAGYVVTKASWPDARLRKAMVLMFVSGFFKYAERTGCLAYSSTENLRLMNKNRLWFDLKSKKNEVDKAKLENLRKEAKDKLARMKKGSSTVPARALFFEAYAIIKELIAMDAPLNKAHNIAIAAHGHELPVMLKGFLSSESHHNAYKYVGAILKDCYRWLYTKESARYQPLCILSNPFTTTITTSIALAFFRAAVDKAGDQFHTSSSSRVDVTVTYVLLVGALALDVCSAATIIFRHLSFLLPYCRLPELQWSQQLRQYNIISTAGMYSIWKWLACDEHSKPVTKDHTSIKKFILDTLLASGTRKEWSIASTRGQLALQNHSAHFATTTTLKSLEETIASSADFPTSMLVLHIATDICYHFAGTNSSSDHDDEAVNKHKQTSTELSNYIMYLVFKRGVMLTTNSKIALDNALEEIIDKVYLPRKCGDLGKDKGAAVIRLFEAVKDDDPTIEIENQESTDVDDVDNATAADDHIKKLEMNSKALKSPVLPRAVAVAQELIGINDEAKRWELIAMLWAEMLYYIAPRCGSDFHNEHLSTGGEFVTHVLLLMYYLGPFLPPPS